MNIIITVFFVYFSSLMYSQNPSIKMINLSKNKIEFLFFDSVQTKVSYKRIYCDTKTSYYQTKKEEVYINPFLDTNQDNIINEMLIGFIKRNYDYEKAK